MEMKHWSDCCHLLTQEDTISIDVERVTMPVAGKKNHIDIFSWTKNHGMMEWEEVYQVCSSCDPSSPLSFFSSPVQKYSSHHSIGIG